MLFLGSADLIGISWFVLWGGCWVIVVGVGVGVVGWVVMSTLSYPIRGSLKQARFAPLIPSELFATSKTPVLFYNSKL